MSGQEKKKSLGCFGIGCLILIGMGVALIGGGGFGYYRFTRSARQYTAGSGGTIAVEDASPQEYEALVKRMHDFKNLPPGSNATLTLTAHDLNVLIARSPEWKGIRGKIRVSIGNGQVGLIGSIPLSSIPNLRDQYLNGALYFTSSIEGKVFHATIQDIKSDAHELSKASRQLVIASTESNLNNRLLGDPVIGTVLIKAETMKVENDSLVLTSAK